MNTKLQQFADADRLMPAATRLLHSVRLSGTVAVNSLPTPTAVAGVVFYIRLSVCLSVFPHGISKTEAAWIAKLDTEMFRDVFWKPIHFRVKWSKIKVTCHKNITGLNALL